MAIPTHVNLYVPEEVKERKRHLQSLEKLDIILGMDSRHHTCFAIKTEDQPLRY